MLREIEANNFTNRLCYPVNQVPAKEFLAVLENYAQEEETKQYAEEIQTRFYQSGKT